MVIDDWITDCKPQPAAFLFFLCRAGIKRLFWSEKSMWAGSNKDNSIDNEELLAVYNDLASIERLLDDMEEVESIWMGSVYRLHQLGFCDSKKLNWMWLS